MPRFSCWRGLGEISDAVETSFEMKGFWTVEMHLWPPATGSIDQSDHIASVFKVTMMTSSCKVPNCRSQVPDRTWARDWLGHVCVPKRRASYLLFPACCCALWALLKPDEMAVLCGWHVDNIVFRCLAEDSAEKKSFNLTTWWLWHSQALVRSGQTSRYHRLL